MKAEKPATGISILSKYQNSVCFRVECKCTSSNHSVDSWIEVERVFDDVEDISMCFYVNTYTHPFARGFWQRIKNAVKVLIGVDERQHEILLNRQSAKNWVSAVENAINEYKKDDDKNNTK
jgi:hypothetical protein